MAGLDKPLYTEQQLLDIFKEYFPDFKVTLSDIKNPTQPFVIEFYKRILVEFNADIDSLMQPQMSQTVHLLYPEAYMDIIPLCNLVQAIKSFEIFKPYHEFRLTDLVNPKPKRNLIIMSVMMNFLLFCDNRISNIKDKLDKVQDIIKERDQLLIKADELKRDIQNKAIQRAEREMQFISLQKEFKELTEAQVIIMKKKEECTLIHDKAKAKLEDEENKLKKVQMIDKKLCEEVSELKEQIVESSGELVEELQMMQETADKVHEKKEKMINLIETKRQITEKLSQELNAQKQCNLELQEIVNVLHKIRDLEEEQAKCNKHSVDVNESLKEVTLDIEKFQEKIKVCQKQKADIETELNSKKTFLDYALEEHDNLRKEYGESAEILKQINKVNEKIEKKKLIAGRLIKKFEQLYEHVINSENESNSLILNELDNLSKTSRES